MEGDDGISPFDDSFLWLMSELFFTLLAMADVDMAGEQSIVAGINDRQLHAPLFKILHDILLKCDRDITALMDKIKTTTTIKFRIGLTINCWRSEKHLLYELFKDRALLTRN
jgi:hypothetical protein